jgi:hypothetical protein
MTQKKNIVIFFLVGLFSMNSFAQKKHEFFVIGNSNVYINNSMFVNLINPDYEAWSAADNKFSFSGGYTYSMNKQFGIGINIETENISFYNFSNVSETNARRMSYGAHFQCRYPDTDFHFTGAGLMNLSKLKSDDLKLNCTGFEYGLFLGPEYSIKNLGLAFLFCPKFSSYFSKENKEEAVLILAPRLSLKLTYSINIKTEGRKTKTQHAI